jgi:hypothetical protein
LTKPETPYCTYQVISEVPADQLHYGVPNMDAVRVQVTTYAKTQRDAAIHSRALQSLFQVESPGVGLPQLAATVEGGSDGFDDFTRYYTTDFDVLIYT